MINIKKHILLFCLAGVGISVQAGQDNSRIEWRFLGPSFAMHDTLNGSYITKPASGVMDCKQTQYAYACDGRDVAQEVGWSETNPAFGIEVSEPSRPDAQSRDRAFATFVRDSYGNMSLMAGVGRGWPVANLGSLKFEAGISGGLWYRTVADGEVIGGKKTYCHQNDRMFGNQCIESDKDYYITQFKRAFVPFVLPFLSITEQHTGIGVNIALAPKFKIGQYSPVPTTTLMIQTTYRF